MAFRKRNVGIQRAPANHADLSDHIADPVPESLLPAVGVRPSPLTGQPTTSTGAYSLDSILGGHAGLALGSSLLVEESGTTDFAGALVRYYAAEGITQGHVVHIVGVGEQWVKDLPALVGTSDGADSFDQKKVKIDEEKMKIAWRYERLGQVDSDRAGRVIPDRAPSSRNDPTGNNNSQHPTAFCHTFDLAKRLTVPSNASINHIDRGGGGTGSGVGDDLAFTVSRRKFVIKPFSLPPMEGDVEAQQGQAEAGVVGKATKVDIEF
ncbi:hypothetical protein MBLNU459_g2001t2 [Dothideomycetes sp. NU459]